MRRLVGFILLMLFAVAASGLGERLHVWTVHVDEAATAHAHGDDHGPAAQPADSHDAGHCLTCHALHAPMASAAAPAFDVSANAGARRALLLQTQRLDASVPAPRGCRGPPVG